MNAALLVTPWNVRARVRGWLTSRLPRTDTQLLTQGNVYILPTRAGWMFALTLVVLLLASVNYQLNLGYVHGFTDSQAVVYSKGGETDAAANIGLTDGATYYVTVVDQTTIKLSSDSVNRSGTVVSLVKAETNGKAEVWVVPANQSWKG